MITNDVSARDVTATEDAILRKLRVPSHVHAGRSGSSHFEDGDGERFVDLRLQLHVNGEVRQDSTVDMIYRPHEALACLTRFQHLDASAISVLTGTPGGTAPKAPQSRSRLSAI